MKTMERIAILCAVLLPLFSCHEKPVPVPPEPEGPQPETRTLTFVLPDFTVGEGGEMPAAVKTAWKAGDQIVVHGEYAKDQVVVTLAAGDISGDGKSATVTVDGLYPYLREDCSSTLYASYPASVADNLKHCFFYSKFSTTNQQIMAACNSGDTFQFQNICGILSMSVEGNLSGYTISTPKKDALGYEFLQVKITDQEQLYKQYVGNPLLQMDGTVNGGEILVFLPEGTSFPGGFVIKFKEGDDYTKIYKYTEPVEIARGAIVDLGDITGGIQHYDNPFSADIRDLDANGNANCYIVTEPGGYKFKAVKGNNPILFLEEPDNAEVIWETWNDVSEVVAGSVVASASYAEDYIIIHTPDVLRPGNAIVAAKNADGKILWSWHIWVPKTPITSGSYSGIMGENLMDRNLGALVVTEVLRPDVPVGPQGPVHRIGRAQRQHPGHLGGHGRRGSTRPDLAGRRHREPAPAGSLQQRRLARHREQQPVERNRKDHLRPVSSRIPRSETCERAVLERRPHGRGRMGRERSRRLAQAGIAGCRRVPHRRLPRRLHRGERRQGGHPYPVLDLPRIRHHRQQRQPPYRQRLQVRFGRQIPSRLRPLHRRITGN